MKIFAFFVLCISLATCLPLFAWGAGNSSTTAPVAPTYTSQYTRSTQNANSASNTGSTSNTNAPSAWNPDYAGNNSPTAHSHTSNDTFSEMKDASKQTTPRHGHLSVKRKAFLSEGTATQNNRIAQRISRMTFKSSTVSSKPMHNYHAHSFSKRRMRKSTRLHNTLTTGQSMLENKAWKIDQGSSFMTAPKHALMTEQKNSRTTGRQNSRTSVRKHSWSHAQAHSGTHTFSFGHNQQ